MIVFNLPKALSNGSRSALIHPFWLSTLLPDWAKLDPFVYGFARFGSWVCIASRLDPDKLQSETSVKSKLTHGTNVRAGKQHK